jgi:cyanophycin synthetase
MAVKIRKRLAKWRRRGHKVYFGHRIPEYRAMWRQIAGEKGMTFTELAQDLWELQSDTARIRILNHQMEFDNPVTLDLAGRKPLMHRLLRNAGLRVPEHVVFQLPNIHTAYEFLSRYPAGCVIKPANGTAAGDGVTTHVVSRRMLRKAAVLASLYCDDLLAEEMIPGECYRILIIGGRMSHAVCRRGPRLVGDGVSSVENLIRQENERLRRQRREPVAVDSDCIFTLHWQGMTLQSIPKSAEQFLVKSVDDPEDSRVEIRTVYNQDVTNEICESIRNDAETAARILRSDFVGVDLITTDPTIPLERSGGVINEVNTTPALHHHYRKGVDRYPEPALHALDLLLDKAGR